MAAKVEGRRCEGKIMEIIEWIGRNASKNRLFRFDIVSQIVFANSWQKTPCHFFRASIKWANELHFAMLCCCARCSRLSTVSPNAFAWHCSKLENTLCHGIGSKRWRHFACISVLRAPRVCEHAAVYTGSFVDCARPPCGMAFATATGSERALYFLIERVSFLHSLALALFIWKHLLAVHNMAQHAGSCSFLFFVFFFISPSLGSRRVALFALFFLAGVHCQSMDGYMH